MINAKRLLHSTLLTPDLARAIDYYRDFIGLHVVDSNKDQAYLASNTGLLTLVLQKGDVERCDRLAFEVSPERSMEDMQRSLNERGIGSEIRTAALPGIDQTLNFRDNNGTLIELVQGISFMSSGPTVGGAVVQKLGHVAFVVNDPKETADFYETVLGFRTSDWIGDFFVFLRCNVDHHAVNFVRGPHTKMHHMAFQMRDTAHLLNALDQLGQNRIELIWGPVRHGPGHNIAGYHFNPDGQIVEYYAELDQMFDEENGFFEPRAWHRDKPQRPKVWDPSKAREMWGVGPVADFINYSQKP